jgi:hypothetical protein
LAAGNGGVVADNEGFEPTVLALPLTMAALSLIVRALQEW